MTDRKDDYYQPWLRDPMPGEAPPAAGRGDEGLAKPQASPPLGIDLARYPLERDAPDPAPPRAARPRVDAGAIWNRVRRGAQGFADWTIDLGARADIPARVEALEIPRRTHLLAARSGAATAAAARAAARTAATAASTAAATTAKGWRKLDLGSRITQASAAMGRGVGQAAEKARTGIGEVARSGKEGLGEAAARMRPAPRSEPDGPPPSGLEQLLAREEKAAKTAATKASAPDLPLFAGEPDLPLAPTPPPRAKAAEASAAPSISASAPDDRSPPDRPPPRGREGHTAFPMPLWALAAGTVALLAATFWLGGRFGGGMNKAEVEAVVADYIRANPQIIPEALEAQRDREIAQAIDSIRPALEKPYAGAWAGNADGDVTMVVFTDYACGFCRASVPDIDRLLREDKRLKVVFRELPIIAPQSRDAALMALAAARQGKYDAFHHAMFAASSLEPAAIAAAAEKAGVVTDGSADATANEALFQRELDSNLAIATQLRLNATPSWVIGDEMFQGQVGYDALRQAVAKARAKG
ncbi:thioredoxin domain-containing protein [Sphingopyxis sp. DHUNG17]|uniref:DsbA family protein n=1 Tax=Sphingopyxis jiangsuensis TaxID=2871171 RepID=UPI00191FFF0E|nr:thioredoxin domain-containing protein [Sphingopyxis lutea]